MTPEVKSLHVYPVKSLAGIDLADAQLTPLGLAFDRQWMVLDAQGRFVSQRNLAAMSQVKTSLTEDELVLSHPSRGSIGVPLAAPVGESFTARVWDDECAVLKERPEVGAWLSDVLGGSQYRLVRMVPGFRRQQRHPVRYGKTTHTGFADSAPYLVASQASLETLNNALAQHGENPVPMNRFRANIVLDGMVAFEEHANRSLSGPGYRLGLRYPRERCVVVTIDQATARRNSRNEPFRTLRKINPMPDNPRGPAFAQLSVLESGEGVTIRAGDELAWDNPANPEVKN